MLNEVFSDLKGTLAGTKENYNFFQKLYDFNKILPFA
jgi:hypothetical protein